MANENTFASENRAESNRRVMDIPGVNRPDQPSGTQGKKLIVGREISLSGQISACDTLVVEGTVEASLSNSRTVEIAESGVFRGEIEIDVAEIERGGQIAGEIEVIEKTPPASVNAPDRS